MNLISALREIREAINVVILKTNWLKYKRQVFGIVFLTTVMFISGTYLITSLKNTASNVFSMGLSGVIFIISLILSLSYIERLLDVRRSKMFGNESL